MLLMVAMLTAPFHSMSNETFARTGKTGGIAGVGGVAVGFAGSPSPCDNELARS